MCVDDAVWLLIGRRVMPNVYQAEMRAGERMAMAMRLGDVDGGAKALAEWVDARCEMTVYARFMAGQN